MILSDNFLKKSRLSFLEYAPTNSHFVVGTHNSSVFNVDGELVRFCMSQADERTVHINVFFRGTCINSLLLCKFDDYDEWIRFFVIRQIACFKNGTNFHIMAHSRSQYRYLYNAYHMLSFNNVSYSAKINEELAVLE